MENEEQKGELRMILDGVVEDWNDLMGNGPFEVTLRKSEDPRVLKMLHGIEKVRAIFLPVIFIIFLALTILNFTALILGIFYFTLKKINMFLNSGAAIKLKQFGLTDKEIIEEYNRLSNNA